MEQKKIGFLAGLALTILAMFGIIAPQWAGLGKVIIEHVTIESESVTAENSTSVRVVRVVDGDTLKVDMLNDSEALETVRLIGVDTPETVHPRKPIMHFGPEATEYVKRLCQGDIVRLYRSLIGADRDKYNRLLAYVHLTDGSDLNALLVKNGYGYSYRLFSHDRLTQYENLQIEAIEDDRGLWEHATLSDLPDWMQTEPPRAFVGGNK